MKFRFITFLVTTVFVAMIAACGSGSNTNTANNSRSNAVTNLGANNANTGAVVVNGNANVSRNRFNNANITREEVERNRSDYEREKGSSTIGQGANDMWLWVKTRAALATADDLPDTGINVDVVNDVVTLKGNVETAAQKASAVKTAKAVEGVKSVTDQLKVVPEGSSTGSNSNNSNRR